MGVIGARDFANVVDHRADDIVEETAETQRHVVQGPTGAEGAADVAHAAGSVEDGEVDRQVRLDVGKARIDVGSEVQIDSGRQVRADLCGGNLGEKLVERKVFGVGAAVGGKKADVERTAELRADAAAW